MIQRVHVFVDYWNFQLRWNERAGEARCNWIGLPEVLVGEAEKLPLSGELDYQGMQVFASADPDDENLRRWLENFVERQAGIAVELLERKRRFDHIRCRACGYETGTCPACGQQLVWSAEKGVEAALISAMFDLAFADAMDVAILVSSDSDFVPATLTLQKHGCKVINAAWRAAGQELAKAAWATIDLDEVMPQIVRANAGSGERRAIGD